MQFLCFNDILHEKVGLFVSYKLAGRFNEVKE